MALIYFSFLLSVDHVQNSWYAVIWLVSNNLENAVADMPFSDHSSDKNCQDKTLGPETSPTKNLETKEKHGACEIPRQRDHGHSYLFGSDFISVDDNGNVIIVTVPLLPFRKVSHPKDTSTSNTLLVTSSHQNSCHLRTSVEDCDDPTIQAGVLGDLMTTKRYVKNGTPSLTVCRLDAWQENTFVGAEQIPQTPISKRIVSDGDGNCATPGSMKLKASILLPDENSNDFGDTEFSPRLTNMIKSGVVPESPINNSG